MTRALVVAGLACALGAGVVAVAVDLSGAVLTLELLLAVSAAALAAGFVAGRARGRLGSLNWQLALAVGIAIGAILAAVGLAAVVMFISSDDALLVSVMAGVIAAVGLCVVRLLTAPIVHDIERIRDRLHAVGEGERRTDLHTGGSDELADLAAATNAMIEQLSREEAARAAAEQARQRLIMAVSHDLRTPISSLRVLTEAVEDHIATGATRTRYLREMHMHVAVLSALIDDLFELSRAEAGEIALALQPVEIGELVSETVTAMRTAGEERGVRLQSDPPAGRTPGTALVANVDPEKIRRVVLNLLENAIRHTPPGGNVIARSSRRGEKLEVDVTDEGTGIAVEDRAHLFEPFYRGGEHAARSGDGSGLGLAIAQAIVNAHGGEIWLAPSPHGARACFTLPALTDEHTAASHLPTATIGAPGSVDASRPTQRQLRSRARSR
jgi:signal transduction histidine kinase